MASRASHNPLPVFESNARKRLSLVAPMNSSPPAVAIEPPMFKRPVFCLPAGSSSVTPKGIFHTTSPVLPLIAINWPHGGFWHGHALAPEFKILPLRGSPSDHWKRDVGPTTLLRSYFTAAPSAFFSIQPMLASSCEFTNIYPVRGSPETPPQFTPPIEPGYRMLERIGAPAARYGYGVNGPSLIKPPLRAIRSWQNFACSAFVSAAVTTSSALKLLRASGGGFTGMGCVGELCSSGTSLFGTGRSSTPNTGLPVTRSRMYMYPDLVVCARIGTFLPFTVTSISSGAGGRS